MQIGLSDIELRRKTDTRKTVKIFSVSFMLFAICFLFSVCLQTDGKGMIPPLKALENMAAFFKLAVIHIFKMSGERKAVLAGLDHYSETVSNLNSAFVTVIAGGILSLSGAVYQNVFRNPLAAPTMLGVTSGIHIGLLLLVLQYSSAAILMLKERYLYTYGCGLGIVLLIMLIGSFIGKNKTSVTDMLLVGAVISQLTGLAMTFFQFTMPVEELQILQSFTLGKLTSINGISLGVFLSVVLAGVLPIHFMRYSMNALCFGDEECRSMGLNPKMLGFVALLAATLLITASIVHCGSIGMVSLIVPHICRYLFSSDFKYLYYSCTLYGAILLLICKDISNILGAVLGFIPVGIFVSLIGTPIFVWMLVSQRRGWE